MVPKLLNFVGFQAGWFACILGAAAGHPRLGPFVVAALVAVNVIFRPRRAAELQLIALAGVLGYAVDSVLVLGGVLRFPPELQVGWPSTVWMVALWVNLSLTLNSSLGWLRGRFVPAAGLGAVGGPLAYLAGAGLGAVSFGYAPAISLVAVGGAWMISMPALLWINALARTPGADRIASAARGAEGRT